MVAGGWNAAALTRPEQQGSAGVGQPLCGLADVADGHSRGFDPLGEGRDTMFVVRRGTDVYGYRNACPHYDNARMAWKKDEYLTADRSRIRCGAHGALFRVEDGVCEIGPCLGEALTPVALIVRDGKIWLGGRYAPSLRRRGNRAASP